MYNIYAYKSYYKLPLAYKLNNVLSFLFSAGHVFGWKEKRVIKKKSITSF